MYVGKGYLSNGLFKMNVITIFPTIDNNKKQKPVMEHQLGGSLGQSTTK